jgi:hypothetical protein
MVEKIAIILMTASVLVMAGARIFTAQPAEYPAIGDTAPELWIRDASGEIKTIDTRGGKTLVSYFSTSCEWCLSSIETYVEMVSSDCTLTLVVAVLDVSGDDLSRWLQSKEGRRLRSEGAEACGRVWVGSVEQPTSLAVDRTPTHYYIVENVIDTMVVGGLMEVPRWIR